MNVLCFISSPKPSKTRTVEHAVDMFTHGGSGVAKCGEQLLYSWIGFATTNDLKCADCRRIVLEVLTPEDEFRQKY